MAKNWIQGAIKHPGALRSAAKRKGLVKGNGKITQRDLSSLKKDAKKTGNKKLARRVGFAETLSHLRK